MAFVSSIPVADRRAFAGAALTSAAPRRAPRAHPRLRMAAGASADEFVPDMAKRNTMNLLLAGSTGAVALSVLYPFSYFFVPKSSGNAGAGTVAKDALGNNIKKKEYLDSHLAGSRELVQGLRGDATYLIVTDDKSDLEYFALNAVCTHLGCVVPWNKAENKFKCPCHGSQYSPTGAVVRGPAPLPLALEHVEFDEADNVLLKSWKEEDFRTGEAPWWNF
ncbi:Cytochrome b6-f complex iron-sulfur subunit, chloroplastic [Gracilariopsis chorda]|uniref:plastoquinol--plastocyanin reductase n=1 Tax=Gracilariopsis chorda TaxID=448386 RepID=A0A2V3IYF6_9FLOR|nr:Cytochrome b6-f complex iron-sulfur subunit, chloroplastic [Gracilariopsis chorda]|eukprot:PXF47182.1 Cytochrome b6-f complex iron-sulfur subunit, chloroplastic [Gracilariopsis chorda]